MDVRSTRAACQGRTRTRARLACERALALLALMTMLGMLGMLACASEKDRESAAPSPATAPAAEPAATASAEPPAQAEDEAGAPMPGATPPPAQPPTQQATKPPTRPVSGRPQVDRRPQAGDQPANMATSPEPGPTTPAATPEPDPRDEVEAFYASLPEEAIAFHVPGTVARGQVFTVRLIVEPGKSEAEIARVMIEMAPDAGPGEVRTRTARMGDEVQALLSSPTLQIVVRGNDTQLVRRSGVTEWAWDVTATTGGKHRLLLALYAIPQGRGSGLKVKTFEETLTVEVGFVDEVKDTLSEHWEWMWTFVLGPVGALVWRRRQQRLARAAG